MNPGRLSRNLERDGADADAGACGDCVARKVDCHAEKVRVAGNLLQ